MTGDAAPANSLAMRNLQRGIDAQTFLAILTAGQASCLRHGSRLAAASGARATGFPMSDLVERGGGRASPASGSPPCR
ncbi:hypothetical protein CNY89_03575, partial [Amaricoccus sp. HAR-UPW-R2A-40]